MIYWDLLEQKFKIKFPNSEKLLSRDSFDFFYDWDLYELKSRRCNRESYPTTKIPLSKYLEGWRRVRIWEANDFFLVIEWEDFTWILSMKDNPPVETRIDKGRWDRGKDETNYYAFFKVDKFREFIL